MGSEQVVVIDQLRDFKKRVEKSISVDGFLLFGSHARGDSKKDSDVDVLIVSKDFEGVKSFKRSPRFYLMWDYKHDVDFICLTPEEFEKKRKQIGVVRDAVRDGVGI